MRVSPTQERRTNAATLVGHQAVGFFGVKMLERVPELRPFVAADCI